jgi:hypothetical protein
MFLHPALPAMEKERIVSEGVENGVDYVEIRVQGNVGAGGQLDYYLFFTDALPARPNERWTAGAFVKLQAGSIPSGLAFGIGWDEYSDLTGTHDELKYAETERVAGKQPLRGLQRLRVSPSRRAQPLFVWWLHHLWPARGWVWQVRFGRQVRFPHPPQTPRALQQIAIRS